MKTPRQILLDRHRSIGPKLDSVRQTALARLTAQARHQAESPNRLSSVFAVLRSMRWHLVGMSAAWLIVMLLNLDRSTAPTPASAKQNMPSPQQLLMALRENRRQILELMEMPVAAPSLPAPAVAPPRRRSELQTTNHFA